MEASVKLGRIRGITIGIHYSWLAVFAVLTYSLAQWFFPVVVPGWTVAQYWGVGAVAALLLYASVLAHELGHSLVAQSRGIPVRSITLFLFGGVALIGRETEDPRDEFLIAAAGPLVSVLVGGASLAILLTASWLPTVVAAVLDYLLWANLVVAAFNLIPGYPLDGGRLFRSAIWALTGNINRATRIAAIAGVVVGFAFMVGGIVYAVALNSPLSGIWMVAIGWFLQRAAQQSAQQVAVENALDGVRVGSLMNPNPPVVRPDTSLDLLVARCVLARDDDGVPVVDGGQLVGMITLSDVREVPRAAWGWISVGTCMTPRSRLATATPSTPIESALLAMSERGLHQLPVLHGNVLVGQLTRGAVLRHLRTYERLPETERLDVNLLPLPALRRREPAA